MQEHRIDVGSFRLRYLMSGDSGPSLVLLHGVGENALDWCWMLPALAGDHRVYAPDLPGSRGGAGPQADYSPACF